MEPETLKELVEGKFVDALRTVAAEMTMEELHEKRGEYVKRVRGVVAADLLQNGLELETVSLTQLDQTSMEFFNPSNAFDAEGLTRLTEQIERRKKIRNDIEQDTMIQIRNKNLETEKQALDIDRELEYARLAQERELEVQRAAQRAEVARSGRTRSRRPSAPRSAPARPIDRARLSLRAGRRGRADRQGAGGGGDRDRPPPGHRAGRAGAGHRGGRAVPGRSPRPRRPRTRRGPGAVAEEERVFTARETEMAERKKRIELIGAAQEAERDALRVRVAAEAERAAAADRGAAMRAQAEAEADATKIRSLADRIRHEVEAEGTRLMNEAQNILTPEARMSAMRMPPHRQAGRHHPRVGEAPGAHRGHQILARGRARRGGGGGARRRRGGRRALPTTS